LSAEIKNIVAEGDFVTARVHGAHVPGRRGSAIVDIFELEDGKIVAHGDVMQPIPEDAANRNGMFQPSGTWVGDVAVMRATSPPDALGVPVALRHRYTRRRPRRRAVHRPVRGAEPVGRPRTLNALLTGHRAESMSD